MALIILINWPRWLLYWAVFLRISGGVWQMFYAHVDVSAPAPLTPCHANKTFIKLVERIEYNLYAEKLCAYWILAWCVLYILQEWITFLDLQAAVIANILLFHVCCFPRVRHFPTKTVLQYSGKVVKQLNGWRRQYCTLYYCHCNDSFVQVREAD